MPRITFLIRAAERAMRYDDTLPGVLLAKCTKPGTSALSMDVLSIVMYQLPRFWLKVECWNIPAILVTEEVFQVEMSPLKT